MCGIFGMITNNSKKYTLPQIKKVIDELFKLSESRGKESAGIAIRSNRELTVLKKPDSASKMINSRKYLDIFNDIVGNCVQYSQNDCNVLSIIGHSRLVTNGLQYLNINNQPVIKDGLVGVHNGIIVNDNELWNNNNSLSRNSEVDTEVLLALLNHHKNNKNSLITAVKSTYKEIVGSASIAVLFADLNITLLASNTGSLYFCWDKGRDTIIFASEKYILQQISSKRFFNKLFEFSEIYQIKPGIGCIINNQNLDITEFSLNDNQYFESDNTKYLQDKVKIIDHSIDNISKGSSNKKNILSRNLESKKRIELAINQQRRPDEKLKRCTKCLLPESFPYIEFNENGVCNYCQNYKKIKYNGKAALFNVASQFRSSNGEPDCIVGFSGGRDSSFMLHYIKKILKMNPIAFSYDWGMVTDLARRNQARLCGKLGVEQILISADIEQKRKNIYANINAWLKKPDLGMVPLLMAGDKQMFNYYPHKIMQQTGIKLFFNGSNSLEKTDFKLGFCGINEEISSKNGQLYTGISAKNKIQLAGYYGKNYLLNSSYINSSIFDTIHAYYTSYFIPDISTYFFKYIQWDEKEIVSTLRKYYDWELASDTEATWRIGDGTAAFYNYIYYTIAGFSEFDTFRSNQIREGIITRDEALMTVKKENIPRYESLEWYANTIGFDLENALDIIHNIPKMY